MFFYVIIIIFIFFFFFCIKSPQRGGKNDLTSESHPLSEMTSTILNIKAVPNNAAFCEQLITMGNAIVFS